MALETLHLAISDEVARANAVEDSISNIVAVELQVTGTIASLTELHIYGTVEGAVRAPKVTICPRGIVNGDVTAEAIEVHGRVEGRLFGGDVRLRPGAVVLGAISHCTLGIDVAADFEGSITRVQRNATPMVGEGSEVG